MENKESVACCFARENNDFLSSNSTRVIVCPTTGGKLELNVSASDTVQGLKYHISRKLRIHQNKVKLLFQNRILNTGTLGDNNIVDNSRITLLPHLESGLSIQKKESGVLKALENLSDSQVNDFLSGRSPLVLGMRVSDHIVFIQLQLSTYQSRRHHRPPQGIPKDHQEVPSPTPDQHCLSHNYEQLSTENPSDMSPSISTSQSGAVIHKMQHLGKGIYSGRFSGTLDPSLQDKDGHPKRNINTIAHILNDLLGASPNIDLATAASLRQQLSTSDTQEMVEQENKKDDPILREKVAQLQKMMEERKRRRLSRRQTIAPYLLESSPPNNEESTDILSETLAV